MKIGTKVLVGELEAKTITEPKGGWVSVRFADKTEKKVRVKEAVPVIQPKNEEGRTVNADLSRYVVHETKTEGGRKHIDINDDVAIKLREKTLDEVYDYAAKLLDVPESELRSRYGSLNTGMQRMNLGNRLRAIFRQAEKDGKELQAHKKEKSKKAA